MISVVGIEDSGTLPCDLEFGGYTPIVFKAYDGVISGARYIQIFESDSALMQLRVPKSSMALMGFSVPLVNRLSKDAMNGAGRRLRGLPILGLPANTQFVRRELIELAELPIEFSMFVGNNFAEIAIGSAKAFDETIVHGRVEFLVLNACLVGIRVNDLILNEMDNLVTSIRSAGQ